MCFPEEGCELWKVMSFYRVPSIHMYINTRCVMYNGWKIGFCVVGM